MADECQLCYLHDDSATPPADIVEVAWAGTYENAETFTAQHPALVQTHIQGQRPVPQQQQA